MISLFYFFYQNYKISYFILLTEITRSRDQFLSYETKTTTVRDQDQDRCKTAETKTETETTKNWSRDPDRSQDLQPCPLAPHSNGTALASLSSSTSKEL